MAELAFPQDLEPFDHLMLRSEHDPRARSGYLAVSVLESVPDFEQIRATYDRASRVVVRLRQKVVVPTLPIPDPRWVVDPDFDLGFHIRRMALPAPGRLRDLLDLAQPILATPFDLARPLWELYLVEGLTEEGAAALLFKTHHAVMDGMAAAELLKQVFDFEPDAPRGPLPPVPVPETITPEDLTRRAIRHLGPTTTVALASATRQAAQLTGHVVRHPFATAVDTVKTMQSAQRMFGGPPAPPSPVLRRRSIGRRFEVTSLAFEDLRRAAKTAGGSLNDAYLAAVSAVFRLYHEGAGVPIDALAIAMPVSTRREDDPAGGNRFTGATLALPISERDPAERIRLIHEIALNARGERAMDVMTSLLPLMSRLPASVMSAMASRGTGVDVQASNVPGYTEPIYVAGVRILRSFGFGPVPGIAAMITMTTMAGRCEVGVNYDTAAIQDADLFARCLAAGFDEVVSSAPAGRQRRSSGIQSG